MTDSEFMKRLDRVGDELEELSQYVLGNEGYVELRKIAGLVGEYSGATADSLGDGWGSPLSKTPIPVEKVVKDQPFTPNLLELDTRIIRNGEIIDGYIIEGREEVD